MADINALVDANGKPLDMETVKKRDEKIRRGIIGVVRSHNLTTGQAICILHQMHIEMSNTLNSLPFDNFFGVEENK
jgi:hypothetical protein